jgi:hypothetical protein
MNISLNNSEKFTFEASGGTTGLLRDINNSNGSPYDAIETLSETMQTSPFKSIGRRTTENNTEEEPRR